jgi:hypothetical protein
MILNLHTESRRNAKRNIQLNEQKRKEKNYKHMDSDQKIGLYYSLHYGLKSFLKGPSFLSLAASVSARNRLNPVVAAPRPSAAALVRTSSREATSPTAVGLGTTGATGGAGAIVGVI